MITESVDRSRDPEDMLGYVLSWPRLLGEGAAYPLDLPSALKNKSAIVCCGMGGSAIGASIVGEYLQDQLKVPYQVVRDYELPTHVSADTLVLAISYSGNTEETIACYEAARERGATVLVISTGGTLIKRAETDGVPAIAFEGGLQPRASLPFTLGLLLSVFSHLEYVGDQSETIEVARRHLKTLITNPEDAAVQAVVEALPTRIPIVYGAGWLGEAARRFKGQICENGKQTAAFEVLPEQNHNALVGYEFPANLPNQAVFVLLRSPGEHERHRLRLEITKDLLVRRGLPFAELLATGEDRLAQLCSVLYRGDLASVYLAYRNGTDPTPVEVITELKARLAAPPA